MISQAEGCTQHHKDLVAANGKLWTRGAVFGFTIMGPAINLLPVWPLQDWNSVCITANTGVGGLYTIIW